jgi:hypothetical protein
MTFDDFHHALRIMCNLDQDELVAAEVIRSGEGGFPDWDKYQVNPFRWFIRIDDERAHRLFALIEARLKPAAPRSAFKLRPMSEARKDGKTIILARFDDRAFDEESRWRGWNGRWAPIKHHGQTSSGYDMGWGIAGPVGQGGFIDANFAGWVELPSEEATSPRYAVSQGVPMPTLVDISGQYRAAYTAFLQKIEAYLWDLIDQGCRYLPIINPKLVTGGDPKVICIKPEISGWRFVTDEMLRDAQSLRRKPSQGEAT